MRVILLILLFAIHLQAVTITQIEKRAVKNYINGDYNQYLNNIVSLIKKNPSSPHSLFYLVTLKVDKNLIPNFNRMIPLYLEVMKKRDLDLFTKQILISECINFYLNTCEFEKAEELRSQCGYISQWNYIGPFKKSFYNDINYNFFNIENDPYQDWKGVPYKPDFGWIQLKLCAQKKTGIIYSHTHFYLSQDSTVILWFTSDTSVKVFLNNQLLFKNENTSYHFSLNNLYSITLKKGWHSILVKSLIGDKGVNFKCRLLNEKGDPVKGIKYSLKKQKINKDHYKSKQIYPLAYNYFQKQVDNKTKKLLDYFKLCLIDFHYFNENRALKTLHRYMNITKENPFLNYLAARIYLFKYNKFKKRDYLEQSKKHLHSISASLPHFHAIKTYLAKYQIEKKQYDKAFSSIKNISKNIPFEIWGNYFNLIKWDLLKTQYYYQAYKKNNNLKNANFTARYLGSFNITHAVSIYSNLEYQYFQQLNKEQLLKLYLKQGNSTSFLNLIKKIKKYNPYDINLYYYQAIHDQYNNPEKNSIKILQEYLKIYPSYIINEECGDLLVQKNDKESALKYYEQAFQLKPNNIRLYKKISDIKHNKIFASLEDQYYPIDTKTIIKKALNEKNPDKNMIKMYLDLMIVKPFKNEGYTYLVHQIYKIHDEQGKERFGEIKIPANNCEIISVNNHLSSDKVIEGLDYKKHNNNYYISLSELKIGSVVEVCYQVFYPYNWLDHTEYFYFSPFSFQEVDYTMENSILVLIEDQENISIKHSLQNDQKIEYEKDKIDSETVHIWKKEHSPKLEKEYNSIPILDLVPHIYLSSIPTWKIFYNWYWGKISGSIKADHAIQEKILEIYESSKQNNRFNTEEFIKNAYYFIQKNIINTSDYLFYPEDIELVFSRKKGNTEEKTLLMYAFLKNININADLVLVRNNQFSQFNFDLVYPEAYNTILIHIPKQHNMKKKLFLDFSDKNLPMGYLKDQYYSSKALSLNNKQYKQITTPLIPDNNKITGNYSVIINEDVINIDGKIIYSGNQNVHKAKYKQHYYKTTQLLEYINSLIDHIAINNHWITNINNYSNLCILFKGEMDTEDSISIIFDTFKLSKMYIAKSERKSTLKIYYPLIKEVNQEITYNGPYQLKLKDVNIKNKFGTYQLKVIKKDQKLIIKRYIKILPQRIEPGKYKSFLHFCRKIDKIEETKLVLKK